MNSEVEHIKFRNRQNPNAQFDLLRIEDLFLRKDLKHSPEQLHLVEFFLLIFIEEGEGTHTIDFRDFDYQKGSIITIRKDQLHKFNKSESAKGFILLFTDDFLVTYLESLEAQRSLQLFNELLGEPKIQLSNYETEEISSLIHRMNNEYFNTNDEYSLSIIRSELHILITKLYRIKSKKEQIICDKKYLNEFIELQNLVEQKVAQTQKVKDYARLVAVSTKTLNNITKSIINKTAKEFIDEICIKQIKRYLINTEYHIKEIAYKLGFEETTNFYK